MKNERKLKDGKNGKKNSKLQTESFELLKRLKVRIFSLNKKVLTDTSLATKYKIIKSDILLLKRSQYVGPKVRAREEEGERVRGGMSGCR